MKFLFRFLVSLAALFAVVSNVFADDSGSVVVMDRAYYDAQTTAFMSSANSLDNRITFDYNGFRSTFSMMNSSLGNLVSAYIQPAEYLIGDVASNIDQSTTEGIAQAYDLNRALQYLNDGRVRISDMQDGLTQEIQSLDDELIYLRQLLSNATNAWPVAISSTNLNLYVIVTNSFCDASNCLCCAENSYTNFLNYYRGIEDSLLDQYRSTVTNLLDWSEFPNWLDYSYWSYGNLLNTITSYRNIIFDQAYWNVTLGFGYPFNSGAVAVKNWTGFSQTLPSDASYSDFLIFSLQGIHDSLQYIAKTHAQDYSGLFVPACTNSAFTYTFANSQTNAFANFLRAPDTYGAQVSKIAKTRNWYQRLEHWLSAIAYNTSDDSKPDVQDSSDEVESSIETLTNSVSQSISDPFDLIFDQGAAMTNTLSKVHDIMRDDLLTVLNHFALDPNRSRGSRSAGDDQLASQRFNKLYFMDTSWIGSRLRDSTSKDNSVPDYLVLQDISQGQATNSAWSITLKLLDILHTTFGVIWTFVGFGFAIYECIMLSKFFINVWWRLIKYIPFVSRYTLGS